MVFFGDYAMLFGKLQTRFFMRLVGTVLPARLPRAPAGTRSAAKLTRNIRLTFRYKSIFFGELEAFVPMFLVRTVCFACFGAASARARFGPELVRTFQLFFFHKPVL